MPDKFYTDSLEWVRIKGDTVTFGLSKRLQEDLGTITYLNLPTVGTVLKKGDSIIDVESEKAVSELYSPVSGKVIAINEEVEDSLESVNSQPEETWLIQIGQVIDRGNWQTEQEFFNKTEE